MLGGPIIALPNHVGAEPSSHVTTPIAHVGTSRLHSLYREGLWLRWEVRYLVLARFATLLAEGPNAGEGLHCSQAGITAAPGVQTPAGGASLPLFVF